MNLIEKKYALQEQLNNYKLIANRKAEDLLLNEIIKMIVSNSCQGLQEFSIITIADKEVFLFTYYKPDTYSIVQLLKEEAESIKNIKYLRNLDFIQDPNCNLIYLSVEENVKAFDGIKIEDKYNHFHDQANILRKKKQEKQLEAEIMKLEDDLKNYVL